MKKGFALLLMLIFVGCATVPIQPEISSKLKTGKIASTIYFEKKTIEYSEMVYKVLWNETRTQSANFDGIWDVDKDLTEIQIAEMNKKQLNTVSLRTILNDEPSYDAFVKAIQKTHGPDGRYMALMLDEQTNSRLNQAGIDFVVLVRTACFTSSTTSVIKLAQVYMPSILIVYDVNQAKEVHNCNYTMGGNVSYGDSSRDLEANNLSLIKEESKKWVQQSAMNGLPKQLGLN